MAAAVGGIVVGMVLTLATDPLSRAAGGAGEDLRTACRYLEDIGSLAEDDIDPDGPLLWRLDAALTLATAAERGGAGDSGLEEAVADVRDALRRFDLERVNAGLDAVRDQCV